MVWQWACWRDYRSWETVKNEVLFSRSLQKSEWFEEYTDRLNTTSVIEVNVLEAEKMGKQKDLSDFGCDN